MKLKNFVTTSFNPINKQHSMHFLARKLKKYKLGTNDFLDLPIKLSTVRAFNGENGS